MGEVAKPGRGGRTRMTAATRRAVATGATLLVAASGVVLAQPVAPDSTRLVAATAPRPNIVFLMVDDMRADDLRFMPRTRHWLGGGGVTFSNAVMPNPLCCPSRASVLTGLHSHNHKVWSHAQPYGFHSFDDRSTLAVWLRRAGYTTTYLGKYLNGYGEQAPPRATSGTSTQYVPPGWSQWRASIDGGLPASHPQSGGTYRFYDTTLNNNGNGYIGNQGKYQTEVYGAMTAASVKRLAARRAPFFSYVSFTAPHNGGPREADDPGMAYDTWRREVRLMGSPARPARVHGKFDDLVTEAPGRAWEAEDSSALGGGFADRPPISEEEWGYILELSRQRAEALSVVDESVGRIMRALRRSGELGRTMVVFTSDNGYFLGERRIRDGKSWPYGPSARVPLLIRGPGIPAGEVRHDPYLSIDHAGTLAAAARVQPPYPTDGHSMLDVARAGDQGWDRPVLTESPPRLGQTLPSVLGIRTPEYLYTRWDTGEQELFRLSTDGHERHNLVDDPAHAETVALLQSTLDSVKDCRAEACNPSLPPGLGAGSGGTSP